MRRITVVCLLLLLLVSSSRVESLPVEGEYEFLIEKEINLLREFSDDNLNYEKNTQFEYSIRVTIDEYNTQDKRVTYTSHNSIKNQWVTPEYTTSLNLINHSYSNFIIPTLFITRKNSINYIADILFYESLDLPIDPYPFVLFSAVGINQALLNLQVLNNEIPEIVFRGIPFGPGQYTLNNLLGNASSYIFMGESSIDQGLKNVNNDTKSWDFEIELNNYRIYNEILDEFWKYYQYTSGIRLSYTDDLMLSSLESKIDYIANCSNYIETKSTVYRVTLVEDETNEIKINELFHPSLSLLLIVVLAFLIIKYRRDEKLFNRRP